MTFDKYVIDKNINNLILLSFYLIVTTYRLYTTATFIKHFLINLSLKLNKLK